ncbi:MAG: acetate kinase [candidate division WS1 bacterium]|nr:acetate kinase [candidate division WS1 bacterium]
MKVLVVNCGSSSLKYQLFDSETEQALASGVASRVAVNGGTQAQLEHRVAGNSSHVVCAPMPDHEVALGHVLEALVHPEHGVLNTLEEIGAVGHRVVHGGERFSESVLIDDKVIAAIEGFCEIAPLHNPANLQGILASRHRLPGVPMVAVFDTAFHQTLPPTAYIYGLPYELYEERGIRRYGFHGTSHRYVAGQAVEVLGAAGRSADKIITCHLGNGCSITAVEGGKSVQTSMGFTPLAGLLMGTRCGDIDPALVPYLINHLGMDSREIDEMLNKRSGLLGISGVSSDMRDIHAAAEAGNPRARLARDIFCYRLRRYIGAYAAVIGGVDAVVFTAGIGENDAWVRAQAMQGLGFLGLCLDEQANADGNLNGSRDVATAESRARILIIPTNEELLISRDTAALASTEQSVLRDPA